MRPSNRSSAKIYDVASPLNSHRLHHSSEQPVSLCSTSPGSVRSAYTTRQPLQRATESEHSRVAHMPFARRILYSLSLKKPVSSSSLQHLRPALHSFGDLPYFYIQMYSKQHFSGSHGIWPVCDLAERVRQSFDVLRKVVAIYLSAKSQRIFAEYPGLLCMPTQIVGSAKRTCVPWERLCSLATSASLPHPGLSYHPLGSYPIFLHTDYNITTICVGRYAGCVSLQNECSRVWTSL